MGITWPTSLAFVLAFGIGARSTCAGTSDLWTVDDFEDGDRNARPGLAWVVIDDSLLGGDTSSELRVVAPGATDGRGALVLSGQLRTHEPAFSGAWTALDGAARPVDLDGFRAIRLTVRGRGAFLVGLRRAEPSSQANFMGRFEVGPEWSVREVPFAQLRPVGPRAADAAWSTRDVTWIGVSTAPDARGDFRLELGDIALVGEGPGATPAATETSSWRVRSFAPSKRLPEGLTFERREDDPAGDGASPRLPDALGVDVDAWTDPARIWIRVRLAGPPPQRSIGFNLIVDSDGDTRNGMPWWGANTAFRFDRLVTLWLDETGPGRYQGVVGAADSDAVAAGRVGEGGDVPSLVLDGTGHALVVGVPHSALGGVSGATLRAVVAVGSSVMHNDDVPDAGALELRP